MTWLFCSETKQPDFTESKAEIRYESSSAVWAWLWLADKPVNQVMSQRRQEMRSKWPGGTGLTWQWLSCWQWGWWEGVGFLGRGLGSSFELRSGSLPEGLRRKHRWCTLMHRVSASIWEHKFVMQTIQKHHTMFKHLEISLKWFKFQLLMLQGWNFPAVSNRIRQSRAVRNHQFQSV